jgi:hypothetical protein
MAKRKISVDEIVTDVLAGLSDADLMEKYRLSRKQLDSMFQKLLDRGALRPSDLAEGRQPAFEPTLELASTCPHCGGLNLLNASTCPDCGRTPSESPDSWVGRSMGPEEETVQWQPEQEAEPLFAPEEQKADSLPDEPLIWDDRGAEVFESSAFQTDPPPEVPAEEPPRSRKPSKLAAAAVALIVLVCATAVGVYTELIPLPSSLWSTPPPAAIEKPSHPTLSGVDKARLARSAQPPQQPVTQAKQDQKVTEEVTPAVPSETPSSEPVRTAAQTVPAEPTPASPPAPEPERPRLSTPPVRVDEPPVPRSAAGSGAGTTEAPPPAPQMRPSVQSSTGERAIGLEPSAPTTPVRGEGPAVVEPTPAELPKPMADPTPAKKEPETRSAQLEKEKPGPATQTKPPTGIREEAEPLRPTSPAVEESPPPRPSPGSVASLSSRGRDDIVSFRRQDLEARLLDALKRGDEHEARVLLEIGASPDSEDEDGVTALMHAVKAASLPCTLMLLKKGANTAPRDKTGLTALDIARRAGKTRLAELIVAFDSEKGPAALLMACREGLTDMVRVLVENGVDVNVADADGNTPLMFAVGMGNLEAVRLLLNQGAQVSARNRKGDSALSMAYSPRSDSFVPLKARREVVRLLRDSSGQGATQLPRR